MVRAERLARLVVALVVSLSAACVVTPPSRAVWPCETALDCEDGWVCDARAGDEERICAPRCTADTDCGSGASCLPNGACAASCSFTTEGRPLEACPEGLSCGRLRYPFGATPESEGLCGRAPTCTNDEACPAGMQCASSVLPALRGLSNLPCLYRSDGGVCPAGWVPTELGCWPSCDQTAGGVACPAGMACFEGTAAPLGARPSESLCLFGFYGASCRSDVECFAGRCADVGGGERQCTERCDDAARVSGLPRARACSSLLDAAGPLGSHLVMRCTSEAADAVCVARGGVGSGCRVAGDCVAPLECFEGTCTRTCASSDDCALRATDNALASGYCEPAEGRCRPLLPGGAPCDRAEQCVDGACLRPFPDPRDTSRCGAPRALGDPCFRDEECVSRRCASFGFGGICVQR